MKLFLVEVLENSSSGTFSASSPSAEEKPVASIRHSFSSDSCGNFILKYCEYTANLFNNRAQAVYNLVEIRFPGVQFGYLLNGVENGRVMLSAELSSDFWKTGLGKFST